MLLNTTPEKMGLIVALPTSPTSLQEGSPVSEESIFKARVVIGDGTQSPGNLFWQG